VPEVAVAGSRKEAVAYPVELSGYTLNGQIIGPSRLRPIGKA